MEKRFKKNGPVTFHADRLDKLKSRKSLVISIWNDLFHKAVSTSDIYRAWNAFELFDSHTILVLTKRIERAKKMMLPARENIWLGVTAENQKRADERIPILLETPAAVRFLSLEPLLGPVDLEIIPCWQCNTPDNVDVWPCPVCKGRRFTWPSWVIVGAESGPRRRECKIEWVEDIVRQCQSAGVPVFVKQLSINGKVEKDMSKFPEHLRIRQIPEAK